MSRYVLITSQDPLESAAARRHFELAAGLAQAKHEVTVFLVENGVLGVRAAAAEAWLPALAAAGARVLADEFALRERGIAAARVAAGIVPVAIDTVIDELLAGARTLWS